jgi:hypothetical protein
VSEKDRSIADLLERLDPGSRGWIVVDHWDDDLCATAIASRGRERRLVYVSTFGKAEGRYYMEFEEPLGPEPEDYNTVKVIDDCDYIVLFGEMDTFFDETSRDST